VNETVALASPGVDPTLTFLALAISLLIAPSGAISESLWADTFKALTGDGAGSVCELSLTVLFTIEPKAVA
jgi:hypothetical protein